MKVLGVLGLVVLLVGAALVGYGFGVYQEGWRLRYAETHLKNAITATSVDSIVDELERARELLEFAPKTGNTDPIVHSPRCNLATAWRTLDEIIEYARTITPEDPWAYRQAMDDTRARINLFIDDDVGRMVAFEGFVFWSGQWAGLVGWILSMIAGVFLMLAYEDFGLIFALVIWIGLTVFMITINCVPVWYVGGT